jgi:hypothetical protein
MFEIRVVLERVGRGESRSEVERVTGHTRKTIGRYVKRAEKLGWRPGMVVTDELAGAVARASGVARERGPGESELLLLPHQERIRAWLTPSPSEKRGLRLAKVQQLLEREGVRVPYSSLHRFAVTHCGSRIGGASRCGSTTRRRACTPRSTSAVWAGARRWGPAAPVVGLVGGAAVQSASVPVRDVLAAARGPDRGPRGRLGLLRRCRVAGGARQPQGGGGEGRSVRAAVQPLLRGVRPPSRLHHRRHPRS